MLTGAFWTRSSEACHPQDSPSPPLPCPWGRPALQAGKGSDQAQLAFAPKPVAQPALSVMLTFRSPICLNSLLCSSTGDKFWEEKEVINHHPSNLSSALRVFPSLPSHSTPAARHVRRKQPGLLATVPGPLGRGVRSPTQVL